MGTAKYTHIGDAVSLDARMVEPEPASTTLAPWSKRKLLLTLVTAFALLLALFKVTSPASEPTAYNPLPSKHDRSFNSTSYPVVLWHGMGDSCCATWSIGALKKQIQEALPGTSERTSLCIDIPCIMTTGLPGKQRRNCCRALTALQVLLCTALPQATTLGMTPWEDTLEMLMSRQEHSL